MKKIMVVENQEELKNLFRLILQMYNYEVGMAINAESLFTQLEKERSDLILLDMDLEFFGDAAADICSQLRSREHLKNIPVLLCSTSPQVLQKYGRMYSHTVIEKPFDLEEVTTKIRQLVN